METSEDRVPYHSAVLGKVIGHRVDLDIQGIELEIDGVEALIGPPSKTLHLIPKDIVTFQH